MAEQRPPARRVDKARLDAVFGDALPATTDDECEPGSRAADEAAEDRWLREQVPPHNVERPER